MKKLTANQIATLKEIKTGMKEHGFIFNGQNYVSSVGMNANAVRSLLKRGLIEKYSHKIYTGYYRITDAGQEMVA